jgi:CelD/BcsL family acetyltransferase involved in cellulose biosynthesis
MNAHARIEAELADRFEFVDDAERLAEIGPAWTALCRRTGATVFQSHEWISAWWATVPQRDRRQLRIGVGWRGADLIAVLPLAIQRRKGLRWLEWAAIDCTDYPDVLVDPRCPPAALARLWREAMALGGFDIYLLNRLRPDATFRSVLDGPDGPKLRPSPRSEVSSQVSGDWTTGAQWFESQTKKTRQNYRRARKALEETGEVVFRLMASGEPTAPVLARLGELKRRWLADSGRVTPLFDEGAPALPALVDVLNDAGALRIFVLECAGKIIAISVNFVQRGTLMAFVTGYDPEYERGSPGMVLLMDYVQWAIDQGLQEVDFLCGSESFKARYATQQLTLASVMGPRTLKGRLAMLADDLRRRARERIAARRATAAAGDQAER